MQLIGQVGVVVLEGTAVDVTLAVAVGVLEGTVVAEGVTPAVADETAVGVVRLLLVVHDPAPAASVATRNRTVPASHGFARAVAFIERTLHSSRGIC